MSKIVNAIEEMRTGRRFVEPYRPLVLTVEATMTERSFPKYKEEYWVGVTLGTTIVASDGNELPMEHIKRMMAEAIFGEFRADLNELNHALYNFDMRLGLNILNRIEEKMFYA